ncbi:MAG: chromosome segregation protein SMC [Bacteroidales bacterium]|nr:chromosome segregation protein SMC [Bacteroidales bacterium]
MLTRLELIGFKSFAEKTRFEFAPGITAVVGPNGSGKSNVVDAVRWILGEQSAKNLRGGEMTDVIFNGSSSRKSLGLAEVTMTFDNTKRHLNTDSDEVEITRRVYRDGEGEYLINGRSSRLKDIKELFLGSGAGHGAYSIIEQGRVDALLSASTKDRRIIFEEAAGISRFKARKIEALRKLEETDRNLSRVRDILQELDKQLRTLRLQAAKAQRYQEYSTRLRELRVGIGTIEYRELSAALTAEESVLATLRAELAGFTAQTETGDTELKRLDWELSRTEDALRHQESRLAEARQLIVGHESIARTERAQITASEQELLRLGRQRAELVARIHAIEKDSAQVAAAAHTATQAAEEAQTLADQAAAAVATVVARIAELTRQLQADRTLQFELVGRSAKHHSDADTLQTQLERLQRELDRKQAEATQARTRHRAIESALAELSRTDADLQERLGTARSRLAEHTTTQAELRQRIEQIQSSLEKLREQRSDYHGRADVLDQLERGLEGFGAGVRAIHERLAAGDRLLTDHLVGLTADLITAPREIAPLVDLVLGDAAQQFITRDAWARDTIADALHDVPGRVGFLPFQAGPPPLPIAEPSLAACVRCDLPGFETLPAQLLGRVLLAANRDEARRWQSLYPDCRIVARTGELLEPDGTIIVGPLQSESGLFSRKSELRELRAHMESIDRNIALAEQEQNRHRRQAEELDEPIQALTAEIAAITGAAGSLRDQILEQRQMQRQLADQMELVQSETRILSGEIDHATAAWQRAQEAATETDRLAAAVQERLRQADGELAQSEVERERTQAENTTAQVTLNRTRDHLAGLRRKQEELNSDLRHRRIDGVNLASTERAARQRLQEATLTILRATAAAAFAYADKEAREQQVTELTALREQFRSTRDTLRAELEQLRGTWKSRHDAAHARELTVRDLRNRRDTVVARIREDFDLDLAALVAQRPEDSPQPVMGENPEQEITDLRRKIEKLGSVNLEALEELHEVEGREKELRTQHDDLTDGQKKLQAIIDQINTDSRRLFSETLTAVRTHFQELFRKLFAGGQADIVLENEADILESGIEITARPPGKELRKISLLSGGEKALTAVALLLAIFRSRPSPFCLLDEVDAAMDEGNTQRLAQLLREFSDRSQFIVITHKKRTMAVADVLYGITMQESGVSKQVAVRFEDWPNEEENLEAAA